MNRKILSKIIIPIFISFFLIFVFFLFPSQALAAFRFVSWGDTKSGTSTLVAESKQAVTFNPKLTIYNGDLCDSWSTSCIQNWINYVNGGTNNGMYNITFPIRGNHDSGSGTEWSTFFNQAATAARIGATNYAELTKDMTYSFDVENSRFIGIDVTGSAGGLSAAEIAWLETRLTDAESKGLTHAFIYFHGPPYCVDGHCSCATITGCNIAPVEFFNVLNRHPVVSATFHGHEHVNAYTYIDSSRVPPITNLPYEQFVTGDAGAGVDSCKANRTNYCMTGAHGFAVIDVNGATVTVNFYKVGASSSDKTITFTKGNVTPPPPGTRTPTPPPGCTKPGDANCDGKVDGFDYVTWWQNFGKNVTGGSTKGDFNNSGFVDGFDYVIWWQNFGK